MFLNIITFYSNDMTICIAAIGNGENLLRKSEAIVFAIDHMISVQAIGQFEHSIEKYRKINSNTIVMLSGEALLFDDILLKISKRDKFNDIVAKMHMNMIKIRDDKIQKQVLEKFKIDFNFVREILNFIKAFSLNTSVILAGFKDGLAQIAEINEIATVNIRDLNFDAIGSGGIQAINTLLFQRHSKANDLKTTLYNVYKAKRNSEVAIGVGKETDIFIMLKNGKIYRINEEQTKKLNDIYQKEMMFGKKQNELDEIINNLEEVNA